MFYSHESAFMMPTNAELADKHTSPHIARGRVGDRLVSGPQATYIARHD